MKNIIWLFIAMGIAHAVNAQTDTARNTYKPLGDTLADVYVISGKFLERKKNVIQKIEVITKNFISKVNAQNTGDLLQATGNVFVQKSQQGGSSPVIRGFEASRVLLVIDGIRMNNLIYRAGHLQNSITVDQNLLERAEVMYGPASTLYGSDALGGAVVFKTKDPKLSTNNKLLTTANLFTRYSSANNESTTHADVSIGGKKLGLLLSGTFSNFGDMRMGANYSNAYPNFGRRSSYVQPMANAADFIVTNSNSNIQKFSGYKQWDVLGKLILKPNANEKHTLNAQFSNTNNIPRYDRLQDVRNGTFQFAEWYYGPQKRNMVSYNYETSKIADGFRLSAHYQDLAESRFTRNYRNVQLASRIERVKVGGFNADFKKNINAYNELHFGADAYLNSVKSIAYNLNIISNQKTKLSSRYPDGENTMNNYGVYIQHTTKFKQGKWILNDGIRLQTVSLFSSLVDTAVQFKLPFLEIRQNPFGVAANVGLSYIPNNTIRYTAGITSGFRAPNIDDLTKVFESSTASKQLNVPNTNIKPEKTINFELGFAKTFDQKLTIDASVFYTIFNNAIATAPFTYNGQDSVLYNNVKVAVVASQNLAKAYLFGFSAGLQFAPAKAIQLASTINYTYGRYTKATGLVVPSDHIPPTFGKSSISIAKPKWYAEFYCMYNGWKRIKNFNPDGEDNGQYATIDVRAQFSMSKILVLQAAIENIGDKNYRVFASGFSAPGRNFLLSVRLAL
jgi:hemoglobin/transferrin/lactoferrin receptor protein